MKNIFFFLFFIVNLYASSKHIFVLQSYSKGIAWTADMDSSIESVINKQEGYEISTEYMDAKKNNSKEYLDALHKTLQIKFKKLQYDAVIVVDSEAIEFVLKFKDVLFKNIPIVFCGIDKSDEMVSKIKLNFPNSLIALESKEVDTNVDFILKTLPNLQHLYMISDYSNATIVTNHLFTNEIEKLKKLGVNATLNLDGNIEKINKDIKNLPKNSAILFGTLFQNKEDKYIEHYKFNNIIDNSKIPVFSTTDSHLGDGIVGGYLITAQPMGQLVAQEVINILNGKKPIGRSVVVSPEWIFDYNMLQKYKLSNIVLPKNSKIVNTPMSFIEKYQTIIEYVFLAFPVLFAGFIITATLYFRSNSLYKKLQTNNLLQKILLDNIQSSVFWTSYENRVLGCNLTFCNFLNLDENQIIGKNILHILPVLNKQVQENNLLKIKTAKFTIGEKIYSISNQGFYDHLDKQQELVSIITDITQSEKLARNKQFVIQQSKLSEIGTMISAIAHQWKNPLVELSAISHKILYYSQKNKLTHEHIKNFHNSFMEQTIYMSNTIDNFRDFIKPSKKAVIFCLNTAIEDVLTFASHSIRYSNTKLNYNSTANKKQNILGYPNEFKQVLLSIINNANDSIQIQKNKIPLLRGEINVDAEEFADFLTITISDNGTGISDEVKESIFEAYFTTKPQGDGFGLYMAQLIISTKMNGDIKILPSKEGAKLQIKLPKKEENENITS